MFTVAKAHYLYELKKTNLCPAKIKEKSSQELCLEQGLEY